MILTKLRARAARFDTHSATEETELQQRFNIAQNYTHSK